MMTVKVNGAKKTRRKLQGMAKQNAFALSEAINEVLAETQNHTIDSILPDAFTLRSRGAKWWKEENRFGFRVRKAKKTRLEGHMGSRADWVGDHEVGGVRSASYDRSIPTPFWKKRDEIMKKAKKPRALRKKAEKNRTNRRAGKIRGINAVPFVLKSGIFARVGGRVRALFLFARQARIKKSLSFGKRSMEFAKKRIPGAFSRAWSKAIRTAK